MTTERFTILVAQPSRTIRTLVRLTLTEFEIVFAADGPTALNAALAATPDLALVDSQLAGLDGLGLIEVFRNSPRLEALPVILTIADYETPDLEALMALEVAELLTKPFERQALLGRVQALLGMPDFGSEATKPAVDIPTTPLGPQVVFPGDTLTKAPAFTAVATPGPALDPNASAAVQELSDRLNALEARFETAVDEAVTAQVEALSAAALGEAVVRAVDRLMPEALDGATARLDAQLGMAIEAQAKAQITAALEGRVDALVKETVERIAWSVVPEVALDIIREEIVRLTSEG